MGGRSALVLGVSAFHDESLAELPDVMRDAEQLSDALRAEDVGGFNDVSLVVDPDCEQGAEQLAELFGDRESDDLVLLHIVSRIARDPSGAMHFLFADSKLSDLGATALSADWIVRQIARCRSASIVVLVDGSCPRWIQDSASDATLSIVDQTHPQHAFPPFGRALITSEHADAALESCNVTLPAQRNGSFTQTICRGILSGAADIDGDGEVTVRDLYGYLKEQLLLCSPSQTPLLQVNGTRSGLLVLARNPQVSPASPVVAPLDPQLSRMIGSPRVPDRRRAVAQLADLAATGTAAQVRAAQLALHLLANDDSRRVSQEARAAIAPWAIVEDGDHLVDRLADRRTRPSLSAQHISIFGPITTMEVHMSSQNGNWVGGDLAGRDMNKQNAGRDIVGSAAGRNNVVQGSVTGDSINDIADLRHAISEIAEDVNLAKMDVREKLEVLTALKWLEENIDSETPPDGAEENVGRLKAAGGWVWERFMTLAGHLPAAGVAAWLYEVAKHSMTT